MSYSIKDLRNLSDEQLIKEHDQRAVHTSVGTRYYEEELDRRSRDRSEKAAYELALQTQKLATRTYRQSWISVIASIIALTISVLSYTAQ